jgi:hypothetical protein
MEEFRISMAAICYAYSFEEARKIVNLTPLDKLWKVTASLNQYYDPHSKVCLIK